MRPFFVCLLILIWTWKYSGSSLEHSLLLHLHIKEVATGLAAGVAARVVAVQAGENLITIVAKGEGTALTSTGGSLLPQVLLELDTLKVVCLLVCNTHFHVSLLFLALLPGTLPEGDHIHSNIFICPSNCYALRMFRKSRNVSFVHVLFYYA